ncbi:MAG: cupin domain-containing protein, partial [Anaerovoracaceae bacterium]
MKKLICAEQIEAAMKSGEKTICIDSQTIITPSAKDMAEANNIEFVQQAAPAPATENCGCGESVLGDSGLSSDMIYAAIKMMAEKGMLKGMFEDLAPKTPYVADVHKNGLKVVKGNSVVMDNFDTGVPSNKVTFQELVSKEESKMSAGFLVIEDSKFDWNLTYDEIDYVIEGTLTVTIDGITYTGKPGDVLFVPTGSNV